MKHDIDLSDKLLIIAGLGVAVFFAMQMLIADPFLAHALRLASFGMFVVCLFAGMAKIWGLIDEWRHGSDDKPVS